MFIKNKKLARILSSVLGLILVVIPIYLVFAQGVDITPVSPPNQQGPINSPDEFISLLKKILTWIATIFWIASIIFIFWAALNYLLARGDEEKADKAKKMLQYAIIAIVIGLMAYAIPTFVENFLRAR